MPVETRKWRYVGNGDFIVPTGTMDDNGKPVLKKITKGAIILWDAKSDLDVKFPNRFTEITDSVTKTETTIAFSPNGADSPKAMKAARDEDDETDVADESENDDGPIHGEDVTEEFPGAKKKGLLVFKDGKKFFVTKESDQETTLHEKPLRRAKVAAFIKELEVEDEE